jgi:hypothetical protein
LSIEGGVRGNQRRLVCPNCGKVFFSWRPDELPGQKVKCYFCRHEFADEAAMRPVPTPIAPPAPEPAPEAAAAPTPEAVAAPEPAPEAAPATEPAPEGARATPMTEPPPAEPAA